MNSARNRFFVDSIDPPEPIEPQYTFLNNIPSHLSSIFRDYLTGKDEEEDKGEGIQSEEAILRDLLSDEKEEAGARVRAPSFYAWDPTLPFSKSFEKRVSALKKATARAFIAGNVSAGLALVRSNPWLIHEDMEGTVVMGKRSVTLKGKPLQILARLGDLNPIWEEKEEPIGGVEQLIALNASYVRENEIYKEKYEKKYSDKEDKPPFNLPFKPLSAEEIEHQLNAVFPHGWDSKNRMEPLKAALEKLISEIAELDVDRNITLNNLLLQAKYIINQFQTTIFNLPQPETGFVFDPRILPWFIGRFWEGDRLLWPQERWIDRLGGESSTKSHLVLIVGLGSLQALDTACGIQIHCRGLRKVVVNKEMPDRSIHFSSVTPNFYSRLGTVFFLSLRDGRCLQKDEWEALEGPLRPGDLSFFSSDGWKAGGRWPRNCYGRASLEECYETKTKSLKKFMRASAQPWYRKW